MLQKGEVSGLRFEENKRVTLRRIFLSMERRKYSYFKQKKSDPQCYVVEKAR